MERCQSGGAKGEWAAMIFDIATALIVFPVNVVKNVRSCVKWCAEVDRMFRDAWPDRKGEWVN